MASTIIANRSASTFCGVAAYVCEWQQQRWPASTCTRPAEITISVNYSRRRWLAMYHDVRHKPHNSVITQLPAAAAATGTRGGAEDKGGRSGDFRRQTVKLVASTRMLYELNGRSIHWGRRRTVCRSVADVRHIDCVTTGCNLSQQPSHFVYVRYPDY